MGLEKGSQYSPDARLEKEPFWLRRVKNISEAASALMGDGVEAVGFERPEGNVVPDIRPYYELYSVPPILSHLAKYIAYKDAGGEHTSLISYYLSDEGRRAFHDYRDSLGATRGQGDSKALATAEKILTPFFEYMEMRLREVYAAFPDYELDTEPRPKTDRTTPDWHQDRPKAGRRRVEKRESINVLIGIYGEHAEFAADKDGSNIQRFREGATTAHWGGEDGAWHRTPTRAQERLSVSFLLVPKKKIA